MWRRITALVAVLAGAVSAQQARPVDAGAQCASTVRGGETLPLEGVRVVVDQVTSIEQKCPANARCLHSGIIKMVHFRVFGSGPSKLVAVPQGATQVVDGVELKVLQVRAGPEADVAARRLP